MCGLPADAIFDPCGHVVACMECATMLKKCFRCKVVCVDHLAILANNERYADLVIFPRQVICLCRRIVHYFTAHGDYLGIIWYIYHRTSSMDHLRIILTSRQTLPTAARSSDLLLQGNARYFSVLLLVHASVMAVVKSSDA